MQNRANEKLKRRNTWERSTNNQRTSGLLPPSTAFSVSGSHTNNPASTASPLKLNVVVNPYYSQLPFYLPIEQFEHYNQVWEASAPVLFNVLLWVKVSRNFDIYINFRKPMLMAYIPRSFFSHNKFYLCIELLNLHINSSAFLESIIPSLLRDLKQPVKQWSVEL